MVIYFRVKRIEAHTNLSKICVRKIKVSHLRTSTPHRSTEQSDEGQRIVTHVPVGFCTKFGDFHPELRIFMNFSWVIVMYDFVGCSNVYLKIIVKYEDDHHIRDPLTRDLDFPIFFLIDFKF